MKILFAIISAITVVMVLWFIEIKPNGSKNGFTRHYISKESLQPEFVLNTKEELLEIAGIAHSTMYFSTFQPGELVVCGLDGRRGNNLYFNLGKVNNILTIVDSPHILLIGGTIPAIFFASVNDTGFSKKPLNTYLFTRIAMADHQNFFLRQFERHTREQLFARYYLATDSTTIGSNTNPPMNDGGVVADGMLLYDKSLNKVVYVYYHKGGYDYIDTNLKLVRKGHTIDTFAHFKNSVAKYKFNGLTFYTYREPLNVINRAACVNNELLFIYSTVKADNEKASLFDNNANIDVYDLNKGGYRGSFYVPDQGNRKLWGIQIRNNKLIAIYPNNIAVFQMPQIANNEI